MTAHETEIMKFAVYILIYAGLRGSQKTLECRASEEQSDCDDIGSIGAFCHCVEDLGSEQREAGKSIELWY